MIWLLRYAAFLIMLLVGGVALAQTEGATWTSISISKKLNKKFRVTLTPELRWYDKNIEQKQIETKLTYKYDKVLSTSFTYRFANESDNNGAFNYHRIALDIYGKIDMNRFEPRFRLRYTNTSDINSVVFDGSDYLRYKFGIAYNIPEIKLSPELSTEAFQELQIRTIKKWRYTIGIEYPIYKAHEVGLAYKRDDFRLTNKFVNILELKYRLKL